jgi:hypothetical protein
MDNWFESLAAEVGSIWRSTIRFGAVTETMQDVSDENDLGRHDVDEVAEELVRKALEKRKGYLAVVPQKRKSPAQVWGCLEYDAYFHIALVQVKTFFQGHSMVINMAQEKHTLEHLCVLTLKTLLKSAHSPEHLKKKDVVVSAGLAEIMLFDSGESYGAELVNGRFLTGFTSPDFDEDVRTLLKDIHTL